MANTVQQMVEHVSLPAFQHPFLTFAVCYIVYSLSLATYRAYFDPLSKFPGPKIAAATQLYEFYYDFLAGGPGGRYTWRIKEMHDKYGPIVRISPFELHIADADFYDKLYTGASNPREKVPWTENFFGAPTSFLSTTSHELHRVRRAPLNHFFSKRSVQQVEPTIKAMVEKLCARLAKFRGTGKPVNMRNATAALALDVVTQYAFATPYAALDDEEFAPNWPDAIDAIAESTYLNIYFPRVAKLLRNLPLWMLRRLHPRTASVVEYMAKLPYVIETIIKENAEGKLAELDHPTIFHELLQSEELPSSDRNLLHFAEEAQAIIGAGQVTTSFHLHVTCWHILATPGVLDKLRAELIRTMPDKNSLPSIQKLEEMPYLSAVIAEGHRFTHGVAHRLSRISPKEPLIFEDWVIPPGTAVGMTHMLTHLNPDIFHDPYTFRPERWLGADVPHLRKYFTPFSKGTRSCIGKELAQAELHATIAALFRRFEFEMWETKREDVDIAHDFFVPVTKRGTKGLQVLVK
ncbi:hypothetical protein N0V90_009197 [Kalmusia sp. IMI 367209]|nr:hypothetical protein N0V90_009197 [Kalmusia sp. IMI 367209]